MILAVPVTSEVILGLAAALLIGATYLKLHKKGTPAGAPTSTTAFGKLAEADGKLIALKVATEAKKAEAVAAHAALDEVHDILG